MRVKFGRSIWGIQRRSFNELHQYLNIKHCQNKANLQRIMQELLDENSRIQMRIPFTQSPESDPASFSISPASTLPDVQNSSVPWDESWFEPQHHFQFRFKKRLFGLNIKKVHAFLQNLATMQREELQEIRKEMGMLLEGRHQLLVKLSTLDRTNNLLIEEAASLEALAEEAVESEIQHDSPSVDDGIYKDMVNTQILYDHKTIEHLEEQWKEKLEGQITEQLLIRLKSSLSKHQPDDQKEGWIREIQEMIRQKITEGQKQSKPHSNVITFQQKGQSQGMTDLTVTSHKHRLTMNGTEFWGEDIEHLLSQPHMGYKEEVLVSAPVDLHPEISAESNNIPQERYIESKQSPAITNQAYLLRKKYIVGKLAGADLKDSNGKIIVAKNEVITEQAMNWAEQQGKLAELIVNMMIAGLSEHHGSD